MRTFIVRFRSQQALQEFGVQLQVPSLTSKVSAITMPEKTLKFHTENQAKLPRHTAVAFQHYVGMPLFNNGVDRSIIVLRVHVTDDEYLQEFSQLFVDMRFTKTTKSLWYPQRTYRKPGHPDSLLRMVGGNNPSYPVYIISKGRATLGGLTTVALSKMGVEHYVVVEPDEYELYQANKSSHSTILKLDMRYKDTYDTCDTLGNIKGKGPGGARNFCWDHSIHSGFEWHWVLDDNIREFHRNVNNKKIVCRTGAYFFALEQFVARYTNVAIAGPNYTMFLPFGYLQINPYTLNTRIYSCLLIRNDLPFRWRGRYNEDTDLSLRVLKAGWCTIQCNFFSQGKVRTQTLPGGNTAEFYAKEGTMPKSEMIVALHPDVAKVQNRYKREHHVVTYSSFNQQLRYRDDINPQQIQAVDEYGTFAVTLSNEFDKESDDIREKLETSRVINVD